MKNDDRVTEMKVAFLDFMKSLRVQAPEAINPVRIRDDNDGTEPEPETDADVDTAWDIKMTPEGYPILPNAIGEKEVSKAEGERIMQEYIMQHYCRFITVMQANPILISNRFGEQKEE